MEMLDEGFRIHAELPTEGRREMAGIGVADLGGHLGDMVFALLKQFPGPLHAFLAEVSEYRGLVKLPKPSFEAELVGPDAT